MRQYCQLVLLCFMVVSVLVACSNSRRTEGEQDGGDTLRMRYAHYLTMVEHEDYTEVLLGNPWKQGQVLHRYLLVPKGAEGDKTAETLRAMRSSGRQTDVVRTPVERGIVFTAPHCQLMYDLGCQKCLVGVCDLQYINIKDVHRRKDITDCGSSMQPLMEKIVEARPEALLISPFENSGGYGKLDKLNVPVIETADYMETSPLGRAEWMKFYGCLFGCREKAEKHFEEVENHYLQLKRAAAKLPKGLSVLTERKTGSVWYVPGGQSTTGVLLKDANARYIYADDTHNGSLALSPEAIIDKASAVDVWAFKYIGKPLDKQALLQEYKGYSLLKALQTGTVYECNTVEVPFFEETSFRPDYLLQEMMILVHPGAKLGQLRYFSPMPGSGKTK